MEESSQTPTAQWQYRSLRLAQEQPWVSLLLGAVLALLLLLAWSALDSNSFSAQFDALNSTDIEQGRIDTALPAVGDQALEQTFIPRHNGLSEVEITLVHYGDVATDEDGLFTITLFDDQGEVIADESHSTSSLTHNQVIHLLFETQNDSKGKPYRLHLSGTPENKVSAWGYSLDVYSDGALSPSGVNQASLVAQDLRFVTRYRLTWSGALLGVGETLFYEGLIFLLALLFLPLPGVLLLLIDHAYRVRHRPYAADAGSRPWDPAAWWGAALALGVAAWPVLWLWLTMFRGRWTNWLFAVVLIGGWTAAAFYCWNERRQRRSSNSAAGDGPPRPPVTLPWRWDHLLLLAILTVGILVRLVAVRDTPVLPWVDASRHGLITAVMARNGQTISDFAPYLPVDRFPYHFGFHTLSSSLQIISGWPLERLLLYLGQLVNALVPLTMFAAVWLLIRSRRAGYLAAFLVALPFFFPAYYTTWGRLTQLTAVLLLPVIIAFTWQLVRGRADWIDRWWLLGILIAGLFLIHFRVLVYYLPFPLLVLMVSRFQRVRWVVASAVLAFILAASQIFSLLGDTDPVQRLGRTIPDYNNFPVNYVSTGWERAFLGAAVIAMIFVLYAALRRRPWTLLPLVLVSWVASLFALLLLDRVGLPVPSLFNLNSMYIIVFVPLAILLAVVVEQVWGWLDGQRWMLRSVGYGLTGVLLALMFIYGVRRQVTILNLQTLLVQTEDLIGIRWLDDNLSDEALVAVNSWRWLGETWAVSDGGAWILPLTGRAVSTPPIDYIYNPELFQQVREFNQTASAETDWSDPAQAAWLREQGVTHVFVGKRGGFFDPAKLVLNPRMEPLFSHDGVYIFAVSE